MSVDFDSLSDLNMAQFYRLELAQVKLGIRPSRGTIKVLVKRGFIATEKNNAPSPHYVLTDKARQLLGDKKT